jgi:hypothetical protein
VNKFLGIYMDEDLTWKCHIDHSSCELAKSIGMFNVASVYFPRDVMLSMYHA